MFVKNISSVEKDNIEMTIDSLSKELFLTEWKESYRSIINDLNLEKLYEIIYKYNIEKMKISPIINSIKIINRQIRYKINSRKIEKELRQIFKGLPLKEKYYKNINWNFYYKIKKIKRLIEQ